MWYLYLDESGDLGFDLVNKKSSKFFTVTILALSSIEANRQLAKEVRVTLRRKLNSPKHRRRLVQELKGTGTTFAIKQYFYGRVRPIRFGLYAVSLNKRRVYERLISEKDRVYNFIARQVLDQIPFEKNENDRVGLTIDRSKSKPGIVEFNSYVRQQLQARLDPDIPLEISHRNSREVPGLQAADLFCWGIFQKYERNRTDWYDCFASEKVVFEDQYL